MNPGDEISLTAHYQILVSRVTENGYTGVICCSYRRVVVAGEAYVNNRKLTYGTRDVGSTWENYAILEGDVRLCRVEFWRLDR